MCVRQPCMHASHRPCKALYNLAVRAEQQEFEKFNFKTFKRMPRIQRSAARCVQISHLQSSGQSRPVYKSLTENNFGMLIA